MHHVRGSAEFVPPGWEEEAAQKPGPSKALLSKRSPSVGVSSASLGGRPSHIPGGLIKLKITTDKGEPNLEHSYLLECEFCILATGSLAVRRPPVDYALPYVFDSDSVQTLKFLPKKVIVQGGGIIGIEYAQIFAKLGSEVHLVIRGREIAKALDEDMQYLLKTQMRDAGVHFRWTTEINATLPHNKVELKTNNVVTIEEGVDCLLQATGREGKIKGLNLEAMGVKIGSRGNFVEINADTCQVVMNRARARARDAGTPNNELFDKIRKRQERLLRRVYAVGDVAGAGLATQGQDQARKAVLHLAASKSVLGRKSSGVQRSQTTSNLLGGVRDPTFLDDGVAGSNPACSSQPVPGSRRVVVSTSPVVSTSNGGSVGRNAAVAGCAIWTLPELGYAGLTTNQAMDKHGENLQRCSVAKSEFEEQFLQEQFLLRFGF